MVKKDTHHWVVIINGEDVINAIEENKKLLQNNGRKLQIYKQLIKVHLQVVILCNILDIRTIPH